jgi:hypothetical protein
MYGILKSSLATPQIQAASFLEVPVLVTEQYPDKLGSTDDELPIENAFGIYPKVDFTMLVPEVEAGFNSVCGGEAESVVLFGVEVRKEKKNQ